MDLYDRIKADPAIIEAIENTLGNKISRGGTFRLSPLSAYFIQGSNGIDCSIPDRTILRSRIEEKFGISNIDSYFIPISLIPLTYRAILGIDDPDILRDGLTVWHKLKEMAEGHVKRTNGYFISYISSAMDPDEGIEHEAIHAYMFKHNSHYGKYIKEGYTEMFPLPSVKDHSWIEAVPYVATLETVNMDRVLARYVIATRTSQTKLLKEGTKMALGALWTATNKSYRKLRHGEVGDIPYVFAQQGVHLYYGFKALSRERSLAVDQWKASFELAAKLKKRFGVKEFLRLAAEKHQDELERLVC
jgi:hypothetical protein